MECTKGVLSVHPATGCLVAHCPSHSESSWAQTDDAAAQSQRVGLAVDCCAGMHASPAKALWSPSVCTCVRVWALVCRCFSGSIGQRVRSGIELRL
jgi:hypothetical protein